MAVTLTALVGVARLRSALRLGSTTAETDEATRLLAYATTAIERHLGDAYEDAPEEVCNEAVIRIAGYLFDMPQAARGAGYADALRNSGALAVLAPYRVHRAGTTG